MSAVVMSNLALGSIFGCDDMMRGIVDFDFGCEQFECSAPSALLAPLEIFSLNKSDAKKLCEFTWTCSPCLLSLGVAFRQDLGPACFSLQNAIKMAKSTKRADDQPTLFLALLLLLSGNNHWTRYLSDSSCRRCHPV